MRNKWESPDSDAQRSIKALQDVLGLKVNVYFEPTTLHDDAQSAMTDPGKFVLFAIDVITTWADALLDKLKNSDEHWTDQLLDALDNKDVHVSVEVCVNASSTLMVADRQ